MTSTRIAPALVSVVAAVTLLLTGCSPAAGGGDDLTYKDSPLWKYFEPVGGAFDEEAATAQAKKTEELVAACMTEEGFDYTPVDPSGYVSFEDDAAERTTEEWVASNGWGIVQSMEEPAGDEGEADPNSAYVESLSPGEQEAYSETLHGAVPTDEELNEDGSFEYDWETAGCYGSAQHEAEGDSSFWDDEEFADLIEAMNGLWEKLPKQPELVALNKKWASCMADAEYPDLKTRPDAQNLIFDEMNMTSSTEEPAEPSEEELATLKEKEIDVALADFHCAEKLDYQNVELRAQFALEEQFIADHKSELDALVAAYDKGQ